MADVNIDGRAPRGAQKGAHMSEYIDPEIADVYARLNEMNTALVAAWVLLGRCDATLEALETPYLSAHGRRALIHKMRAEILHAVGSTQ